MPLIVLMQARKNFDSRSDQKERGNLIPLSDMCDDLDVAIGDWRIMVVERD